MGLACIARRMVYTMAPMKTFLLIAGHSYYPRSGTYDWIACFETYEKADDKITVIRDGSTDNKYMIDDSKYDWYKIVDLKKWMNK